MPESLDLFNEVALLRRELSEQGVMIQALLRAQGKEVAASLLKTLQADPVSAAILLLVDGVRSQGEIMTELKRRGLRGASPAAVSRHFERLADDYHLITLTKRTKAGNIYKKTVVDQVLGISRALAKNAE